MSLRGTNTLVQHSQSLQDSLRRQFLKCFLLDTGPVIRAHLQEAADGHSQPDPSSVTQQNIQDHLIPPALRKIRKEMHEEQLYRDIICGLLCELYSQEW